MDQSTIDNLRRSDEHFRIAQELSIDGFSILNPKFDPEGNIVDFVFTFQNAASARMNGTTSEGVIGRGVLELFPGIKNTQFFRTYIKVINTRETSEFEDHYQGETMLDEKWFRILVVPTSDGVAVYAQDITERKKAEQSINLQSALLANVNDAVVATDERSNIIFWNKSAEELFGWKSEEVMGRSAVGLFQIRFENTSMEESIQKLLTEGHYRGEVYCLRKNGGYVLTEANSKVMRGPAGEIKGIVTSIRDITEQKQTAALMKENEERFRTLADNISQLAWMADSKGSIFWYNKRWYDYTGTAFEDMQGLGWKAVHHPDHIERVTEKIQHSWDTGEPWEDTFPLRGRDGTYRWFLSRALPIKNEEGNITLWFGTNTDITDLKKSEEARLESRDKLLEAQKLAHMCSFIFDFQQKSFEWTEEFLNIFEIDSQEEFPSIERLMDLVYPEDRDYILQSVKHALENKLESLKMEYRILTGKGNIKYVQYSGKLSYDEKGQHIRRFGTIIDVTERKLQEMELRRTLENLERSNKDLEQFAYVASHDLQEPLRMVSTYSTILERNLEGSLQDKNKQYLEILVESSKRMHSLITGLLEYSGITSQKESLSEVNMNTTVEEVLKNLSFSISETNTEFSIENLPKVKAYPFQMKLLMQNLISNAIKFTAKEFKPCVEIRGEKKERSVVYSVKDNGIGISPDDFERIFVIFHRLHTREVYSGTGIGLSLCKRIVENHGGRIWVESEPGKGAKFCFSIPG